MEGEEGDEMISFNSNEIKFTLKNKTVIKQWISSITNKKKRRVGDLNFVFCSDEFLLGMNKQYLNHDTYTDIITFDYSKEDKNLPISGDIYISVDRVRENAAKFNVAFENELHRVIIHGTLHLLGYGDKTKAAKEEMRKQEDAALRSLKTE